MKKSLIALAALAAVSGAAQAQSSITIYGILDAGYSDKESTTLKFTSGTNSYAPATKTTSTGIAGNGAESTSRLGFRGTEDLGGGLKANFVFETALNPAEPTLSALNTRQAFVGLEGGFGTLNVGTVYTAMHSIAAGFSSTTLPNVVGDVMYTASGSSVGVTLDKIGITQTALGVGGTAITTVVDTNGTVKDASTAANILAAFKALGVYNSVGTLTTAAVATTTDLVKALNTAATTQLNTRLARANNSSYTVRLNNTLTYQSPTMSGVSAGIAYSAPTSTKVEGGNETKTNATALNVRYESGKFAAGAAQMNMKVKSVGAGASALADAVGILSTYNALGAKTNSAALTGAMTAAEVDSSNTWEVKTKEQIAALSYDLGVAKVSYIYAKRDSKDTVSDLNEKTTHNFGVKAPFGKATAFINYSMGESKVLNGTNAAAAFDLDGTQVGVSYALSKRSDVYAIYGTNKMDNKASVNDIKDTQYAIGLRHQF